MIAFGMETSCYDRSFVGSFGGELFAARGSERVYVGHDRPHFAQANDQCFDLVGGKSGKKPLLALECGFNHLVMERLTCAGQFNEPRAVVVRIRRARRQPLFVGNIKAAAHSTFVETDGVDDLVRADVRKASENAHNAPLGDANSEVCPVGIGCSARESVRNVSEEVGDVPFEVEDLTTVQAGSASANILLHINAPKSINKTSKPCVERRRFGSV